MLSPSVRGSWPAAGRWRWSWPVRRGASARFRWRSWRARRPRCARSCCARCVRRGARSPDGRREEDRARARAPRRAGWRRSPARGTPAPWSARWRRCAACCGRRCCTSCARPASSARRRAAGRARRPARLRLRPHARRGAGGGRAGERAGRREAAVCAGAASAPARAGAGGPRGGAVIVDERAPARRRAGARPCGPPARAGAAARRSPVRCRLAGGDRDPRRAARGGPGGLDRLDRSASSSASSATGCRSRCCWSSWRVERLRRDGPPARALRLAVQLERRARGGESSRCGLAHARAARALLAAGAGHRPRAAPSSSASGCCASRGRCCGRAWPLRGGDRRGRVSRGRARGRGARRARRRRAVRGALGGACGGGARRRLGGRARLRLSRRRRRRRARRRRAVALAAPGGRPSVGVLGVLPTTRVPMRTVSVMLRALAAPAVRSQSAPWL